MRRLSRITTLTVTAGAALVGLGYWSGSDAPIDVVTEGQRSLGVELRSAMVPTNGVRLHVVEAGPIGGPPVVLLHGFPDFWWGFGPQMARLARAGFRVIVPDQRGYNLSDKPAGIEAYRVEELTTDILGLLRQLGFDRVHLGGHDWGGAIAWQLVIEHPERFLKLVMFNSPHPLAWRDARAAAPQEETINWFRTFFQMPWVPEISSRFGNWWMVGQNVFGTARPGAFSATDVAYYKQAWARPGAYGAMITWYRAAFRYPHPVEGDGLVRVPTRIVWGMKDPFFEKRLLGLSVKHCADASVVELPEATHWLLHEEPDLTSRQMIEFFGAP